MKTDEVTVMTGSESLQALNRSEIDVQIATAKQYPRDVKKVLSDITMYATMDEETAKSCFYALSRKDKRGNVKIIEGVSVRMAEIIVSSWGNLRVATRILGNDDYTITAQGVCHDLEKNVAVNVEVKRPIRYSSGGKFNTDLMTLTGNTAAAIAFRNAVLKIVPKAVIKKVITDVKQFSIHQSKENLDTKRTSLVNWFAGKGVPIEKLLAYIGKESVDEIDADVFVSLRAVATGINDGEYTVKDLFFSDEKEELTTDKKAQLKAKMKKSAKAVTSDKKTKPILP